MVDDILFSDIENKMNDARKMINNMSKGDRRQAFEEQIEEFRNQILQSKGYITPEMLKEITDFTITVSLYSEGLMTDASSKRDAFLQRISLADTGAKPNKQETSREQSTALVPAKNPGLLSRITYLRRNDFIEELPDKLRITVPYSSKYRSGIDYDVAKKIGRKIRKKQLPIELIFEEGIEIIPKSIYEYLHAYTIQDIKFPETLTEIEPYALQGQTMLTRLDFSHTQLKRIGRAAFTHSWADGQWGNLSEVVFPKTLEMIDDHAFNGCPLQQLDLSATRLKHIGNFAFSSNKVLTQAKFPDTLEEIGVEAFSNTGVPILDLANTKIADIKKMESDFLIGIKLPNTIRSFSEWNCPNLSTVEIAKGLPEKVRQRLEDFTGIKATEESEKVEPKESKATTEALQAEKRKLLERVAQIDRLLETRKNKSMPTINQIEATKEDNVR